MAVKQQKVLIIDGLNTFIRSFNIIPVKNEDGEHFGGVFGFLQSLKFAVGKFNPTEVVVAWDGPKGGLRRKALFPGYKAHRKEGVWKSITAFDFLDQQSQNENFMAQLKRVQEYLDCLPVKTLRIPYIEADDIIANYVSELNRSSVVFIYSTDADFKQLVDDTVFHYNPIAKKLTSKQSFIDEHGYPPSNYLLVKALMGDKSDNIPGIPGVGEKTVLKLFPMIATKDGVTIQDILSEAERIDGSRLKGYSTSQLKKYRLISEQRDVVLLNHRIMSLEDSEISEQAKSIIRSFVSDSPNRFDKFGLAKLFLTDKLGGQIKNFSLWSQTFSGLQVMSTH